VRILLFLPATLTRAVSGRFRPMRAGFPTGTHRCRSTDEAHSLLGWRECAYRERHRFRKKLWYICWSIFWASFFVNRKTWHLICNNCFITWISWYCMLMCVFVHSRFVENPPIGSWEINLCFFRWVLSQVPILMQESLESFNGASLLRWAVAGLVTEMHHIHRMLLAVIHYLLVGVDHGRIHL
jgi:hypothetical protein